MTRDRIVALEQTALRVREHIIRMSTNGGCFIGASLSCADLLVYLYAEILRITPATITDPDRDYLFLSKGHDVPALYATLAEMGFIDRERLKNHLKANDAMYWHPNPAIRGVEFHSGSLGHLLSVAIGVAIDAKLSSGPNRIYVVLGDGELNEGSIWEGVLVANARRLDNLVAIVDRNQFQANVRTEQLVPLEPLREKFESFGWGVSHMDGHSFEAMDAVMKDLPRHHGRPHCVIANTVRGKGLRSIENRADRWFVDFTPEEVQLLLNELHGKDTAKLISETMMVR